MTRANPSLRARSLTAPSLTAPSLGSPRSVREELLRAKDSEKVGEAVRIARSGALTAGRGLGRAGTAVGQRGLDLARKGAERAQHVPVPQVQAVAGRILPEPEPKPSHRRRNILIAVGIAAVAAGGVAFYQSRRREHPPVAPAPPTLSEAKQPAAPSAPKNPATPAKPAEPAETKSNGKHAWKDDSTPETPGSQDSPGSEN